eukprot:763829-Hanusia_phi.AAC.4
MQDLKDSIAHSSNFCLAEQRRSWIQEEGNTSLTTQTPSSRKASESLLRPSPRVKQEGLSTRIWLGPPPPDSHRLPAEKTSVVLLINPLLKLPSPPGLPASSSCLCAVSDGRGSNKCARSLAGEEQGGMHGGRGTRTAVAVPKSLLQEGRTGGAGLNFSVHRVHMGGETGMEEAGEEGSSDEGDEETR